jgi:hypothetical protein
MIHNAKVSFFLRLISISLFFAVFGLCGVIWGTEVNAQVQNPRPKAAKAFSGPATTEQPLYGAYRGVRIGMTTDEARAKLGQPSQKLEGQDFYVVSETETVQIVYDATHRVTAISVDYLGAKSGAPDYEAIVGADVKVNPDGSMYKLVRYEQLGFWVSYNRTAGNLPIVTVTIQKMFGSR